jgi:subtilisin family serine protease
MVSRYLVLEGPGSIASVRGQDLGKAAVRRRVAARAGELKASHAALRPLVEAAGARIVGELVHLANAFQVMAPRAELGRLARLPGVARLEIPTVVRPSLGSAVPLVGSPALWAASPGLHGEGVRIGILDTGVDYLHAHLGGAGDPEDATANNHAVIEPGSFPTAKVIGGRDFVGDDYDAYGLEGSTMPSPDPDPIDCNGHGTHVAGIAAGLGVTSEGEGYAGPYDASLDPSAFSIYPGVAPAARLFALKVFGCHGSTEILLPALELAVDPDEDGDVSDRLDVINASLGESFALGAELENDAWLALAEAGTLLVVAAGNDGSPSRAHLTLSYPGSLPQALTVGATFSSADASSYLALTVTAPSSVAGTYPVGQTSDPPDISTLGSLNATAALAEPALACTPITNGAEISGKVAIVRRGSCLFVQKAENAANSGALAILVVDNTYSDFPLQPFGGGGAHVIPMWILRRADGEALIEAAPITVSLAQDDNLDLSFGPDYMAYFSSRGPTADHLLLKPDVTAPGVRLMSAATGTGFEGVAMSGTSMATPMVAGVGALLRQGRPELGPFEVKALLTSTAKPVTTSFDKGFLSTLAGAGRVQVDDALGATVTARVEGLPGEAGASFGVILAAQERTETRTIVVANSGSVAASLDAVLEPAMTWPGLSLAVSPQSVEVPSGGTATLTISLTVDPAALPAAPTYDPFTGPVSAVVLDGTNSLETPSIFLTEASGVVSFKASGTGDEVARLAYHGIVRAAAERSVERISGCLGGEGDDQPAIVLSGAQASNDNATSVLELGTTLTQQSDLEGQEATRDILAVGAFVDKTTARVFFGVATAADWTTPARGWLSEVGIEIDTDGDELPDYLVTAESLNQYEANKPSFGATGGPFARVVNLATGALSGTLQPLNGAMAAYPGGMFYSGTPPETYETQIYHNRVLVLPVRLADIGRNALTNGAFAYRAVSGVSRVPLVLGRQMDAPTDVSTWVSFDAAAPRLTLPSCHAGTSLCPNDSGSIPLELPSDATDLPTLLVLHHANAEGPRFETVELESALELGDLAVTTNAGGELEEGSEGSATFTVTNLSGTRRAGVRLSIAITGGSLAAIEPSQGTCDATACELGELPQGAVATVTARVMPAEGAEELAVTATVTTLSACETEAGNDSASATFTVIPPAPKKKSGCGCHSALATADLTLCAILALLGLGLLIVRRRRLPARRRQ